MTSIAPGGTTRMANAYYKTDEVSLFTAADAMHEEHQAIVEAGLVLQLDDPALATNSDMITPELTVEDYQKFVSIQVAALNHAISGLPRSHPDSLVPGQMARSAHDRHTPARHRRGHVDDQCGGAFVLVKQRTVLA
jgi:hypothetical protein